jgi:hypothetical protein
MNKRIKHRRFIHKSKEDRELAIKVARHILPMMFDSKQLAILNALAQSPHNYLNYTQIGEITGIGLGSSLDYNLDALIRIGFVYKEEHGKHSYFYLTDAGKIAALGLYAMLERLIEDLKSGKIETSNIPPFVKEDLEKLHERITGTRKRLEQLYLLPLSQRPKFFRNEFI